MRKLFLSLVFLSALLSIHANPGIKGIVIDQTTRKALDYAHVVLYDGDHIVEEAMTEANGSFLIQPVKPGTYSIRIHFLGYDVYMGEEFILTEQIKDLGIIPMQMLEVGLQEVEVVANKKQVIYKLDKKIIEASSNLLSSGGTAVDILENTPSIRVNAEGEVTFRGSSGFTVYVDGKPSIFTGTQALEQIPSGQIQNIEIITTPSAQHDTGGDVGIINVITKKNFGEGLSGVINLSGNTVWSRTLDFLLTGQNKVAQWRIGGYVGNRLRKSHFTQEKTTLVNDTTTTSYSNGPRESNGYAYILNGGWSYTQKQTTFSINAEGGYTFKRGGDCPSEVKSSLHYLGIPLNLVVYVWKNQRWNVYLSGGFMMEKGLQAVYSGYIAGNGTTISKSKKEGIHGMQWSVNASVGAAYRFYGDWSLYFEPRFSHYFDCDQPASIRTDKPLGFGLSAGIRYAF